MRSRLVVPWMLAAALFAVALSATRASATHVTVRPDGSGDYATINAALVSPVYGARFDTLIAEPGLYDEIVKDDYGVGRVIYGRAGAESTHVRGFEPTQVYYAPKVVGITIDTPYGCPPPTDWLWTTTCGHWTWEHCVFSQGFDTYGNYTAPTRYCTFRGPTAFRGFNDLADCTFESAPAFFQNMIGYVMVVRCTFRGPADALVLAYPRDESGMHFEDCTFADADCAIRVTVGPPGQWLYAERCRFERIAGSALEYVRDEGGAPSGGKFDLAMNHSVVSDVGQAVLARSSMMLGLSMVDDTISTTRGTAIDATLRYGSFDGILMSGAGGDGIRVSVQNYRPRDYPWGEAPAWIQMTNCGIRSSQGAGIRIEQLPNPVWDDGQSIAVRNSVIEMNSASGLDVTGPSPAITGCLLRGNGVDGARAIIAGAAPACSLGWNTAVDNGRNGITVESAAVVNPLTLHHNLVTHNGVNGAIVYPFYQGTYSYNDGWTNGGGPFAGLNHGEANLTLDPQYCMQSAGDFELRAGSPCAPSGTYGQIGALGVGCVVQTATPPAAPVASALRVLPNPARGSVAFAWGGAAPLDELSIFDIAGRQLWSASRSSLVSGSLRWDARDASGLRVAAGVYLVRWRSGARTGGERLVLLHRD